MKKFMTRGMLSCVIASTALLATACPPPSAGAVNWSFRASQVRVNSSQDEVRDPVFDLCISFSGCTDEPYVLNVSFRVKIGVANSAQTFVAGNHDNAATSVAPGNTLAIAASDASSAKVTFNGVVPLDLADLLDANNHIEVLGSYMWAMEADTDLFDQTINAANNTATVLKDALNSTLAAGSLPSDLSELLSIITANLGSAFGILVDNIPTFGLGDDVMGGGLYVGLAVKGSLADIVNSSIGSTSFPTIDIPLLDLPPDITHGGFYTTVAAKDFDGQQFTCCGGQHTWNFNSAPA